MRDHVRYPIDLFSVQTQLYLRYHMRDSQVFFNREDQWDVGNELFFNQPQKVKPYYVIMKLPGEVQEEFVLIMPFTPFNKPNMVAWMAARNDGPYYGQLQTFKFPTGGEDVSGTEQVEARITNDDTVRERLTLLCPEETVLCIRGNLLVIPVGRSVLYVEPLFIRPRSDWTSPSSNRCLWPTVIRWSWLIPFPKAWTCWWERVYRWPRRIGRTGSHRPKGLQSPMMPPERPCNG